MVYHFKIHKEGKGYWAECIELDGCITEGDSLAELDKNMSEALNLYLSEPQDSKMLFKEPKKKLQGRNVRDVHVNPNVAFAMQLRQNRLKRGFTQRQVADLLEVKNLSVYQKLEKALTANPELRTLVRIKKVFPEIEVDEILAS